MLQLWIWDDIVNNIGEVIEDTIRNFFWGICTPLMGMMNSLLNSLLNGVLGFDILSNDFITNAYKCSIALMFLIIPVKIVYEIVTAMVKDDDAGLDLQKKMGSAFLGILIAVSLTIMVPVANTLVRQVNTTIVNMSTEFGSTDDNQFSNTREYTISDNLVKSVIVGFGSMPEEGDYGANNLINNYKTEGFSITERDDNGSYRWNFSEMMTIIGLVIYIILIAMIAIQIGVRVMAIGFYYVIGPLCCTSMTNYQNPQAFTVWKNSLIGQWAMNITQIFLLSLLGNIISSISSVGDPIASAILYFGAFSIILTMPNFVQSMLGGYGAGVMETLNQVRGGMSMAKGATIGAISGAIGATVGHRSQYTGFRQGGLRGAVAGNKMSDGSRRGGIQGDILGNKNANGDRQGGIRGAFAGDTTTSRGADGNVNSTTRQGGLVGALVGSRTDSNFDESGKAQTTTRQGGLRGAVMGSKTTTQGPNGKSVSRGNDGVRGRAVNLGRTFQNRTSSKTTSSASATSSTGASTLVKRGGTSVNNTRSAQPTNTTRPMSNGPMNNRGRRER